jgi:hypothetical protein
MVQKDQKEIVEKQPTVKPLALYLVYQDYFSNYQQQLVEMIVSIAKPEIIFLLGASLSSTRGESIFAESAAASQSII